ncbi:MAG: ADP-ribosylglycohydrolase family protein [Planctomycetes bacterium]|nr:ADP-ribosylglycohydrolase family protein [Planctomycetota bacterium]
MNDSPITGSILGTAVGDAIGLPYEGLSKRRGVRLFGEPDRHHLIFRRGMVSDDTEHTCMVAQSLIASGGDVDVFTRQLARRLRRWFLCLPAGIGLATARALLKLCVGVSPDRSGVFSAGNGPAMRTAVIGAAVEDLPLLRRLVKAATRITHTDPKAEYGALAVALAARMASRETTVAGTRFAEELRHLLPDPLDPPAEELLALVEQAVDGVAGNESSQHFAASLGLEKGVSGYVYHTVPVAIHVWLSHQADFRSAVTEVVRCGGDTDTTAAIVGGIVGAGVGRRGIPQDWLDGLWEWPATVDWMERLAAQLHEAMHKEQATRPLRLPLAGVLPRNLLFLAIVLIHGFRRLFPPY